MSATTKTGPGERMLELWAEIQDLNRATALLQWDQETYMPEGGHAGRASSLSTLAGIHHAKITSPELRDALEDAAASAEDGSVLAAQVREARRHIERSAKIPADLAKALADAASRGLGKWQAARKADDFSIFRDALAEIVNLRIQAAKAIDPSGDAYDTLIDEYEPGAKSARIAEVFDGLRKELSPLVQAVRESGKVIDESPAQGHFPADTQKAFGLEVAKAMGFDFEQGRLDAAAHPFCSGFGPGDVRLTWRWQEDDFRPALYGIMHEAGHGLYEQGLPMDWQGTPIGGAVSMAVHESQSRLWENLVGRSRAFWEWILPTFHKHFPEKAGVTVDQIYPALHTVKPSLIRVEADEATYNLHIVVRFEIERRLIAGEIGIDDLPGVWDELYEEMLGVRAPSAADGVLQDIHWAMGAFGYFPTYALGNLVNAQLFETIEKELGPQAPNFAKGDFAPLLTILREKIHARGSFLLADDLIEEATGAPLSSEPFMRYIRKVTEEVYGV